MTTEQVDKRDSTPEPEPPARPCATGEQAHTAAVPNAPTRDPATGRFQRGNFGAIQHALRWDRLPPEFAHLAAEVAEFEAAAVADDGGETEVGSWHG